MVRSSVRSAALAVVLSLVCLTAYLTALGTQAPPAQPAGQAPAGQQTAAQPAAQPTAALPSDAFIENFLLHARVIKTHGTNKGITGSVRATLTDGTVTHDAQIQRIDETMKEFVSASGTEFNFRDSWMFNVATYRLDRLIGLNMVPVSVERTWQGDDAAFTWWIDDVMMDEEERLKTKREVPDVEPWNQQIQLVRVLDQLIANIDRNMGNLLITKDWRVWAIDHTRSFRTNKELKTPANVTRCDRQVLERLKALDKPTLSRELRRLVSPYQLDALLARRDQIVSILEKAGPSALFDRKAR